MNGPPREFPDFEFGDIFLKSKSLEAKLEESLVVDGHVDLPYFMINHAKDLSLSELEDCPFTLQKARKTGLRLFCTALYCEDRFNGDSSLQHFQDVLHFTLERFDQVSIIKSSKELERLKEIPDQMGTLLLLENADLLAGNPAHIKLLKQAGIWIVGLTHANKNRLADGNHVLYPDGLTREGTEVIRVLSENHFIIDIAHLHPKCFWQLINLCEALIINSHTGARKVYDIPRNIDFEQAGEIVQRGGVIGITFNPEMLSPERKGAQEQVFVHMDTFVQKFGPDAVGIGSDLCGFDPAPEGIQDITGIPRLVEIMRRHGYGDEAVNKIMGQNWLRLYERLFEGIRT